MQNVLSRFEGYEIDKGFRDFITNFGEYVELARDVAYNHSESHRGFHVATVGAGIKPGVDDLITVEAANFKIRHTAGSPLLDVELADFEDIHEHYGIPLEAPKVCAETSALAQITDENVYILGQVIVASTDPQEIKDVTGVKTRTLPPCLDCTEALDKSLHTSSATLYCSAGLEENIFQIRNMRLLKQLHRTKREKDLPVGRLYPELGAKALDMFDLRVQHHDFSRGFPSKFLSNFARASLLKAGQADKLAA